MLQVHYYYIKKDLDSYFTQRQFTDWLHLTFQTFLWQAIHGMFLLATSDAREEAETGVLEKQ